MFAIQQRLETLTHKWWFYLVLLALFFLPTYSARPFDPRRTSDVITAVLSNPLIYSYPSIMPIFKALPVLLALALALWGDKVTRLVNIYVTLTIFLFAWFQNAALTPEFGFAVVLGNAVVYSLVALVWCWETVIKVNELHLRRQPLWRYWVVPVGFLAFWFPLNPETLGPDFSLAQLLTNNAGLTLCMMLPVYLAILILCYPTINRAALRITCFAGIVTACLNVLQWFFFTSYTWLGIFHLPLLTISLYGIFLSFSQVPKSVVKENRVL